MGRPDAVAQPGTAARPRATGSSYPLVTYALFAYNQENTVAAAVESALAQTWDNLEIILSDDCSTDNTFGVMERIRDDYRGTHKVVLNRNTENLGVAQHVNLVMQLAHGELIVAAAGDDLSDTLRVARLAEAWCKTGFAAAVFHSGFHTVGGSGLVTHTSTVPAITRPRVEDLIFNNVVKGATQAWSRKIFDFFGPLSGSLCQEDLNITMRGAMLGGVHYVPEPLVRWRTGGISNSASTSTQEARRRNAMWYTADMAQVILDLHTALRKNAVSSDRYNALVTQACDRLLFETLLQNRGTVPFLRGCLADTLRSYRRITAAIWKLTLLRLGSRG